MRGSFSDWFVCVWCDRGSCDSHRCAARSVIGLFVSGVIGGHVTHRYAARSVIGLFVSGVIGGHVTHRCAARSVIGLFVSGVTLTGARLVQ